MKDNQNLCRPCIKFCGMMREEDIHIVNELKPDFIGFVFWEKSFRNLTIEKAMSLKKLLDPTIKAVGVFVDADITFIKKLFDQNIIDIAQLHGKETNQYIQELKDCGITTIKAFEVTCENDVLLANDSPADYVLLDAGKGSGTSFDWSYLNDMKRPYFLAGGLNPENVEQAISDISPYALDVSSGIETNKQKDESKMRAFAEIVRKNKLFIERGAK